MGMYGSPYVTAIIGLYGDIYTSIMMRIYVEALYSY
jgi:hypothetical protein